MIEKLVSNIYVTIKEIWTLIRYLALSILLVKFF